MSHFFLWIVVVMFMAQEKNQLKEEPSSIFLTEPDDCSYNHPSHFYSLLFVFVDSKEMQRELLRDMAQ